MSIPDNPITPTEQYLAKLLGEDTVLPDHPITPTHQYLEALVAEMSSEVEEPTDTEMTLKPCPKTYDFGEAAELEVTVTADAQYHFAFTCPSGSPTVLTVNGITATCDGNDTLEAGKRYEADVWAGVLLVKNMEITEVTP